MARKRKGRAGRTARVPISDEELIARLQEDAPETLTAALSEATFDAAVEGLLKESPFLGEMPHFYCRKCRQYHLKTHPHYTEMNKRTAPLT